MDGRTMEGGPWRRGLSRGGPRNGGPISRESQKRGPVGIGVSETWVWYDRCRVTGSLGVCLSSASLDVSS